MEDKLISFETAKLAKEKGFYEYNEHMSIFYSHNCLNRWLIRDFLFTQWCESTKDIGFAATNRYTPVPLYEPYYLQPSQGLLQRWLRETKKIIISVVFELNSYELFIDNGYNIGSEGYGDTFDTYEEALEYGLFEALKLIK